MGNGTEQGDWPDAELVVTVYLAGELADVRLCNELPADLADVVPLIAVRRVPGGGDDRVTDEADVDVECFGADRGAAWVLTRRMRAAMHALGGTYVALPDGGGAVVDTADTDAGPGEVPYSNKAVRRTVTTYRLTARAQAPA
ncbi:phage tail termination protein [Streptomonospora litoralis]|uniref:Tail terminator n=1 Tax=Streptomonospora litoralis TaxID=2498135 RepID=A0A4P6PZ16_9ACTN|nr:hypothetical protein [Streptomonospora litoralis]QBI53425.1 hypothetical protein EKD16_08155 [Streptomonospora litoralis]